MKRLSLAALALVLAPLVMAQTPPPATISDVGSPALAPAPPTVNVEPQTASGTAVLLQQQAFVIGVVRTDAPVAGSIPVGNASLSLDLPAGAELYPVVLRQRRDVRLFCTSQTALNVTNPLRPPLVTRTCLAETNGDRVFDNIAYMQVAATATRSVSGAWQPAPVPHVGGGAITISTTRISSPVPFTPVQQHAIAPVIVEVTARIIGDVVNIELRSREGDVTAPLSEQRTTAAKASLPRTVTLQGAQIELQALTEGTLTFRVVSGFPTDQPLAFFSNGTSR